MSAKKRRLYQLKVVSPCSTDWDRMSGDEKKRFCTECDKFVYDFSQMTRRQVEAIVSIYQGRMCARITRLPDGSLLTLENPPAHPLVARRASPVVNATLAAILGLSVPANALNIDVSAAHLIVRSDADSDVTRAPYGGGEALVGGTVFDPQAAAIPNAAVKLISDAGAELKTKTSAEGEFAFAQVPFGSYILLIEARGFFTHVNPSVIVDTPCDMRFDVTMKVNQRMAIMGSMGGSHRQSLLDLYRKSDLVAIARIGRSTIVETGDGSKLFKTALNITSQLKGENNQQVIPFYHWVNDSYPTSLKPGGRLLVLLQHRESEEGKRLDGYEATGWGNGIKQLDDGALAVYRQRIEELTAIFQRGNPDPAEIVEWLLRCVEEPATREESVSKLSELEFQREQENEAKSHLTQDHKTRLANALFGIAELSEADMAFVNLIEELGDERLAPYLVSQLRRVADRAPMLAESLIRMIAWVINDEDLRLLANDYDDVATYEKSEYEESDQRDSTRNQRADGVTVAAIKRSAMIKDFLKLVEYKTSRKWGVGESE